MLERVIGHVLGHVSVRLGSKIGMILLLLWNYLVFPHSLTLVDAGPTVGLVRLWSFPVATGLASLQWISVAALFGWRLQRRSIRVQVLAAPIVIVAAGAGIILLLEYLGYSVRISML